jgi:hypothetical protein
MNAASERKFFTSAERLQLVSKLLEENDVLKTLTSRQLKVLPLNEPMMHQYLDSGWVYKPFRTQPMNEIRAYYGEEIAFYFSFLGMYTFWLVPPAIAGIFAYIHQLMYGLATIPTFLFSVFLALWATLFLEHWKRKEKTLAFEWGCMDYEEKIKDIAVAIDVTRDPEKLPTSARYYLGYFFSFAFIALALTTGAFVMGMLLQLDQYAQQHWKGPEWKHGYWQYAVYMPNIALSLCITLYKSMNKSLAQFTTTKLEVRRTELEKKEALVTKLALFNFINYYAALIHTAFVKRDLTKLRSTLITLLVVQQIVGQVSEIGVPLVTGAFRYWKSEQQDQKQRANSKEPVDAAQQDPVKKKTAEQAKKEISLEVYSGVFDDYLELWVQMGQVCLFSSVFPLAAMVAFLNNVMEIRTDAFKIVHTSRRPIPTRKSGIGSWLQMFDFLGYAAVITNISIIGVVIMHSEETMSALATNYGMSDLYVLLLLIGSEHLLIIFKVLLSFIIPDVPEEVKIKLGLALTLEESIRTKALEQRSKLRSLFSQFKSLDGLKGALKPVSGKDEAVTEALIAFVNEQTLARTHAELDRERIEKKMKRLKLNLSNQTFGLVAILVNVVLALIGGLLLLSGH